MSQVAFKGDPIHTCGDLPTSGGMAPDFELCRSDLSAARKRDFPGKRVVLNVFPSIDTPVCAASVRRFNQEAASLDNTAILCISRDLPFAHSRFCGAEGISGVITLSDFRTGRFGRDYGVEIIDSPLAGLLARAVLVLDNDGKIIHSQLVPEIAEEPDYAGVLKALA